MSNLIASDAIWAQLGKTEAGRRRLQQEQQHREEKKRADAKGMEDDFVDLAVPVIQASVDQIESFTAQLDRFDAATVAALNQNSLELEHVQDRIQQMLLQAHTLEDGRRVFRTEDGTRVFDEFGAEVAPEIVTPDEIDPRLPTWEDMLVELNSRDRLLEERQDILSYQDRLDDARNEVADGEIGADDLDELTNELDALMPTSVQRELGIEPARVPALEGDFTRATVPATGGPNLNLPELNL